MSSPYLPLVGRILLAVIFLVAGFDKINNVGGTTAYLGRVGVPMPELTVWLVIAVELIGGLLLVIGWKTRWTAIVLALFTLGTAFFGHKFWAADPSQYMNQVNHFLKNIAMVGGFLMLAWAGPGRMSVDRQ